jgi:PAS domain-containing protein
MVHSDDVLKMDEALHEHLTGNKKYAVEVRVVTKTGDWRWIMTRGRVVKRNAVGQPIRMVGTHSDITERKEAEQRLLESEERYKAAVDYSGDGIGLAKEGKDMTTRKRLSENRSAQLSTLIIANSA